MKNWFVTLYSTGRRTCGKWHAKGDNYIGIDLNPEYLEITKRRIEKECENVEVLTGETGFRDRIIKKFPKEDK